VSDTANAPLFTVATVCLNDAAALPGALDSALAQDGALYEYVVADGGSSDGTLALLRAYEDRFAGRLRWRSEPDDGLYDAMNKALRTAVGEYIVFLGADDRLAPGALAAVAEAVHHGSAPDIVCGATHVVGDSTAWDEPPRSFADHRIPKRAPARHQSIFVRRERALAAGGFDLRFPIAADYDLYLRLVEGGASERLIPETLSEFRLGGVSNRSALRTALEYRAVRVAHGADPIVQMIIALKSALAATLVAWWMRVTSGSTGAR
jgi:glycosyltransferase involved in cell wall biosynthesis